MINYFKHTEGEAFTLNGDDYVGFFNVNNNLALTGKLSSNDSLELSPKSNFITDVFINGMEFDATYSNIPAINPYYTNSFDLLDVKGMSDYTRAIDDNNITCYKSLILGYPTIFKFEETGGKYYGLASIDDDSPIAIPNKYDYRGNIDPFTISQYWAFLERLITGVLIVNSQEFFKYICSDGEHDYILSGNFSDDSPLTLSYIKYNIEYDTSNANHNTPNYTYNIHHDSTNSKLFFVKLNGIEIYDISNFDECENLILIDKIALDPSTFKYNLWNTFDESPNLTASTWNSKYRIYNTNSPKYIKFGKNIRSSLNGDILNLINKYSNDVYQSIPLSTYGITNVISLDIRTIDDYVIILYTSNNELQLAVFDPLSISTTIETHNIYSITYSDDLIVSFSDIDSNIFYIQSKTEYHGRYISSPQYPFGRLESCDLLYPYDYTWNTATELYNFIPVKWNTSTSKSNSFNINTVSHNFSNNKMYMVLNNVGRFYALRQNMNDRFLHSVPLDLPKKFDTISCNQTSIGLTFNFEISRLIEDTMNIFTYSSNSFTISEYGVQSSSLNLTDINHHNLYFNGNETLNTIVLQRISTTLTNLQYQLLPSATN